MPVRSQEAMRCYPRRSEVESRVLLITENHRLDHRLWSHNPKVVPFDRGAGVSGDFDNRTRTLSSASAQAGA